MISPVSSSEIKTNLIQILAPLNSDLDLEELSRRKSELLNVKEKIEKLLGDIDKREAQIKAQITIEKPSPILTIQTTPTETSEKAAEVAHSTLVIHTNEVMTSKDTNGERKHYSVSLISKNNEIVKVDKFPVDIKKYGPIEKIIISNGESEIALDKDKSVVQRMIKYFSNDFEVFRKEINIVDHNGYYSNKNVPFDCQRFSYYLHYGTEGDYRRKFCETTSLDYRTDAKHAPYESYSIKAQTDNFGRNGTYAAKDMAVHHYVCLTNDVFVSKFGKTDVLFTSYQQILDAYFPPEFTKGTFTEQW